LPREAEGSGEGSIRGTMNLKNWEDFDDEFATRTKLFRVFRVGAFYPRRGRVA
jgi:hypothetical protein